MPPTTAAAGFAPWLVPDWPAPAHVHALCTTRAGGVSAGPFGLLNLGGHVGDVPAAVQANRDVLRQALAAATPGAQAVFLEQVHGTEVLALERGMVDGARADACVATQPGTVCTIMVADCLPVLLAHRSARVVGAAHAGWRGLAGMEGQGVLETVFERFCQEVLAQQEPLAIDLEVKRAVAADTLAWLGPCIGPQAFEVGAEVREAFCHADAQAEGHFDPRPGGKYLADLAGLARQRLAALGVLQCYGNDSSAPWCTVGNPSSFFSHRRDTAALGGSGRFAACVWLG
jgi:YfiH family protein